VSVRVLTTGGTIASTPASDGSVSVALSGADLLTAGALMAGDLPSSKARILLAVAIATSSLHLIEAHLR
jgi:L-asparaginase/Glu-tRNA(Gln) amidotransferase subunit D